MRSTVDNPNCCVDLQELVTIHFYLRNLSVDRHFGQEYVTNIWLFNSISKLVSNLTKTLENTRLGEHNRRTAANKPAANFRGGGGTSNGGNNAASGTGGGGEPRAAGGANAYNPGRMDADRREHDDRDRRDYGEVDR